MSEEDDAKTDVDRDLPATVQPAVLLSGRYRIDALLGSGGMGTVYRVYDLELDEAVALKMLSTLDEESLAQFRAEVKLARRVTHPNVARTFDIGEDHGRRFLTMELVDGPALDRLLAERRLDVEAALRLARDVCAGLRAVHAAGVVHGDLKPSNVLVDEGRAKLTDFGIARASAHEVQGPWPGTPLYMAPERLFGAPSDRPGDVYALGLVLSEIFGVPRRSRRGPMAELDLSPLEADAPHFARVIRACLSTEPAERPDDLGAIEAALDADARSLRGAPSKVGATRHVGGPERRLLRVAVATADHEPDTVGIGAELRRLLATSPDLLVPQNADAAIDATVEVRLRATARGRLLDLGVASVDGFRLWGRSAILDESAVAEALESAAASIAEVLTASRSSGRASPRIEDPVAHELYLEAVAADYRRLVVRDARPVAAFEAVVARAPEAPLALAGLAAALVNRGARGDMERARGYAERALVLAPNLATTHETIARLLQVTQDGEGAARAALRAVSLAPSAARGQTVLGTILAQAGRVDEGLGRLQLALALDPRALEARIDGANVLAVRGDVALAAAMLGPPPPSDGVSGHWFYWVARARLSMVQKDEATTRATVEGIRARGVRDVVDGFADFFAGEMPLAKVCAELDDLGAAGRDRLFVRAIGLEIQAEAAEWVGDLDVVERAVLALDEEAASFDVHWMEHALAARRVHDRPAVVVARTRVAARAAAVLAAVDREIERATTG